MAEENSKNSSKFPTAQLSDYGSFLPSFTLTPPTVASTPTDGSSTSTMERSILNNLESTCRVRSDHLTPSIFETSSKSEPYPPPKTTGDKPPIPLLYIHNEDDQPLNKHSELSSLFSNATEKPSIQIPKTDSGDLSESGSLDQNSSPFDEQFMKSRHDAEHQNDNSSVSGSETPDSLRRFKPSSSLKTQFKNKLKLKISAQYGASATFDIRRSSLLSINSNDSRRHSLTSLLNISPSGHGRRFSFINNNKVSSIEGLSSLFMLFIIKVLFNFDAWLNKIWK